MKNREVRRVNGFCSYNTKDILIIILKVLWKLLEI